MEKFNEQMPNGEYTEDPIEYENSLFEFAKPIEEATGYKFAGYGPGMSFRSDEGDYLTLSINFIEKINIALGYVVE